MSLRRWGAPEVVERVGHERVRPGVAESELLSVMRREEVEAESGLLALASRADHPRAWGRVGQGRGRVEGRGRSDGDASGGGLRLGGGSRRLWCRKERRRGGGGASGDGGLQDGEPLADAAEVGGLVVNETEEACPAGRRGR